MLRVLVAATLLTFCAAQNLRAEISGSDALYVVDMQRVLTESITGKAMQNNLEEEIKKEQGKLGVMKSEVERLRDDLKKQSALLSKDALSTKRDQLETKERELARAAQDKQEELSRKNNAEVTRLVKEIGAIVAKLASEGNYKFVIEKDSRYVLYVDDRYDLTPKVVEILNKKKTDF